MLNKKERMERLNNAGVNTGKYFTLDLPGGVPAGAKIHVVIDENGVPTMINNTKENDGIWNQIIEDGYVRNTKLHRRFVMAQMFQMLNYASYDGQYKGYNDYLKRFYGYDYTFKMMLEEVRVLSKLETKDKESFDERSHFFTKEVVADVLEDYVRKLMEYIDNLPDHKCKGVPYKKVKGVNIFNTDLTKKIYGPMANKIYDIKHADNYGEIYKILNKFMKDMIKLSYNTPKSKAWIDAYKGEGAYYTLKNLVMYHSCDIYNGAYMIPNGVPAVDYLKGKLDEYKGEGWRMFALMKKVIADNHFDFNKRMEEIYNK